MTDLFLIFKLRLNCFYRQLILYKFTPKIVNKTSQKTGFDFVNN
ncbi:hypothetical protein HMPREF0645_1778 [Hallella bergensis DSM 17361]|uniref:Uncharacterized protein n=1 Tax=Hallella bergensis DSM 17361 TaxID=585502 RepID=D1PXU3_9BACT|nr:hypothetical protein HMPREF0645_1778 [Hallella bergensis DSM 17361]